MNTVRAKMNNELKERHQVCPKIVEVLAQAIHLLGKQGLALLGHRGSLENETNYNQGNFLTLVREIVHYYPLLKNHLEDPQLKDVKYRGENSQTELIEAVGKRLIQRKLINEINEAGIYSISADEVTASNDEILSIGVR